MLLGLSLGIFECSPKHKEEKIHNVQERWNKCYSFVHIRLKEFNSFDRTCSISPLTSARCPLMQRDRTPRKGAQLVSRFEKVRREKRGGKVFKRRYKSICLQVLEYFIGLLEFVVYHDQFDPRDRRNQIVLRRLRTG